jgi:hypothetical protein
VSEHQVLDRLDAGAVSAVPTMLQLGKVPDSEEAVHLPSCRRVPHKIELGQSVI